MVDNFKGIIRLGDKDLNGNSPLGHALTLVKGSGFMFANAVCSVLKLDRSKKVGTLSSEEVGKIEDCLKNPAKYHIPSWLFNRQKDPETGEDKHFISGDLLLNQKFDIRKMQKIKCYKGVRHAMGSKKVRGQKTRTTGRRGKTIGVQRKKKGAQAQPVKAPAPEKGGKKK